MSKQASIFCCSSERVRKIFYHWKVYPPFKRTKQEVSNNSPQEWPEWNRKHLSTKKCLEVLLKDARKRQRGIEWLPLETRRKISRLTMLYKIINNLVAIPAEEFITKAKKKTRATTRNTLKYHSKRTTTATLFPQEPSKNGTVFHPTASKAAPWNCSNII